MKTPGILRNHRSACRLRYLLVIACSLTSLTTQAQISVIPAGDSITRGFNGQPSYREEFVSRLTASGCTPSMRGSRPTSNPSHEGYSGHEANDFIDGRGANPGIAATLAIYSTPANPADALLLHIGTNDKIVGDSVNSTLNEIDDIVDIIKTDSPATKIYLANVVPLYVQTDSSGNGRLDTGTDTDGDGFYDIPNSDAEALSNGIEANYSGDPDVTVVDVRSGFRPTDMVADGIHPSPDDTTDPRSDSGEHHIAVAFAAALEADGSCVPSTTDNSFPLTNILTPLQGDSFTSPITLSGRAVDTGGSGFDRVRLAILDGNWENFPSNCAGCTWWDFTNEEFGSFDSINAHLFQSSTNYTQWRAGVAGDPGNAGLQINLPTGEYTLFALAIDNEGNQNYFPPTELWPERTVFNVTSPVALYEELQHPSPSSGDRFGYSVAIDGNTAVVGTRLDDNNGYTNNGSAEIFDYGPTGWIHDETIAGVLDATSNNDKFGHSVALSGNTIAIGAPEDDDNGYRAGRVYVFEKINNNWNLVTTFTAADTTAGDQFGRAIDLDGNTLVVGAQNADLYGSNSGTAYVFERDEGGSNNWGQTRVLDPLNGVAGNSFGRAIAIDGNHIIVGATGDDKSGNNAGTAYIFRRNQGGAENWGLLTEIISSSTVTADQFGYAVDVHGLTAVVGARLADQPGANQTGAVYVFDRDEGGTNNWGESQRITATDAVAGDRLGASVAIYGDRIVSGAPGSDDQGSDSGKAYAFIRSGGLWEESTILINDLVTTRDEFGIAVDLYDQDAVIGSWLDNRPTNNTGGAYIHYLLE